MRTAEVIEHFKTQSAVAKALGIKQPSVALWGEHPPEARQLQIQKVTRGKLKAEPGCMERLLGLGKADSGRPECMSASSPAEPPSRITRRHKRAGPKVPVSTAPKNTP